MFEVTCLLHLRTNSSGRVTKADADALAAAWAIFATRARTAGLPLVETTLVVSDERDDVELPATAVGRM